MEKQKKPGFKARAFFHNGITYSDVYHASPCVFCLLRSLQGRYRITPVPVLSWQYPARSWEAFLLRQKEGSAFQPYSSYQALPFGLIPFRLVLLVMTDSVMTTSVMAASGILIFPLFAHSGQHQQYTGHHHG